MKAFYTLLTLAALLAGQTLQAQRDDWQRMVDQKRFAEVLALAKSHPDTTDFAALYAAGQAAEGLLKYRDAYHYYRRCPTTDSARTELLVALARTAGAIGQTDEAEHYLLQLRARDTADFYANHQLARFYDRQGDTERAMAYYEKLLASDPQNPVLMRNVADCARQLGRKGVAMVTYMEAFQVEPENALAAAALANYMLSMQLADIALEVCDKALSYHPRHRALRRNRGMALFSMGAYLAADSVYAALLSEGDSSQLTRKYGGCARYYTGHFMDAIPLLESAYEGDTSAIDVCLLLGSALGRTYDRRRAFALFDRAEALMQPAPALTDMLTRFRAETFERDGQKERADALYYQLWTERNRFDLLGRIWEHYNDTERAEKDEAYARRSRFITVLFATEYLARPKRDAKLMSFLNTQLNKFVSDMFFRQTKQLPTLAPDGKAGVCTEEQLRTLMSRLQGVR